MNTTTDVSTFYHERAERLAAESDALRRTARTLSTLRFITFMSALAFFLYAELAESPGPIPALAGALLLVAFLALVIRHRRLRREIRWIDERIRFNEEAVRRIRRDWSTLPGADTRGPGPEHDYSFDLDLFGRASLFQLLGTVSTAPGRETLSRWLLEPAPPEVIKDRQGAVAELAAMPDLRENLAVHGRLGGGASTAELEQFLEWAEDRPWLSPRPILTWAARLIPATTAILIALQLAGYIPFHAWAISVLIGLSVTYANGAQIQSTLDRVLVHEGAFREYSGLLELIEGTPFATPQLLALQSELHANDRPASLRMRRLGRIAELAGLRYTAMAHFPIQALTLWDFHVVGALERWQLESGPHARRWIQTLGELDALAALAALAHDNPEWAFPEITETGEPTIEATGLGHPLLAADTRVTNDVRLGPPGNYLLVTGSNMSGKSTLLRAVGTNTVLAQAGGPVCAEAMRLPQLDIVTSMRISDSLALGVSYFMAELNRLEQVVDAARRAKAEGERTLLYLLDEILHGTNTAERQIAAERVVRFLVDHDAIGAVSTHDLALAESPELADAVTKVHFTETVGRDAANRLTMSFDYTLRPGVATSTNALALMEIVGLRFEEEGAGDEPAPDDVRRERTAD